MTHAITTKLLLGMLILATLAIRIAFAGTYAESWDAVDFALALKRYDLLAMQPHFPGYPLYIALGYLFHVGTAQPAYALSLLSAVFGSLSLLPFYDLAKTICRNQLAVWIACLLFALNPLIALTQVQPMSDSLGLFMILLISAITARTASMQGTRLFLAACLGVVLFALLLGIRISYFPLGCLLFFPLFRLYAEHRSLSRFFYQCLILFLSFVAALLLWLLPVAATEGGIIAYARLGVAFTAGHFSAWGGTAFSSETTWWERISTLVVERLLYNGLLGIDPGWSALPVPLWLLTFITIITGFLLIAWLLFVPLINRQLLLLICLAVVPYGVWVYLGQNSEKARHLLPILPWLFLALAHGWTLLRKYLQARWARLVLTISLFAVFADWGLRQGEVLLQHLAPPPAVQLVQYVTRQYPPDQTLLYTWEEQRLFDYYAPHVRTERLQHFAVFLESLRLHQEQTAQFLVTNAVLDGFGADHPLRRYVREAARFEADPFLYPTYHTVILYEVTPAAKNWLSTQSLHIPPDRGAE